VQIFAREPEPSVVAITATRRRIRSAASAGVRSAWFSAERYSIVTFCPSSIGPTRRDCTSLPLARPGQNVAHRGQRSAARGARDLDRRRPMCQAPAMPAEIDINTATGDIRVGEDDLARVSDAVLAANGLPALRVVAELLANGAALMKGRTESDRVRPVAVETRDGSWWVHLVRYSAASDPLLRGLRTKGSGDH
jgi:hypothetical protein